MKITEEKQELTPYLFIYRYAYHEHCRSTIEGSYRASKQAEDAIFHKLDTYLLNYSKFQTKD